MKIIAGCVIALAMIGGTGTAFDSPATKHKAAQRSTVTSPSQSGPIGQPKLASQASRVDRSQKTDRITVVRTTQTVLPPGCEPTFSPLAKLPSRNFSGRCLT
jgi:hypothetical protein